MFFKQYTYAFISVVIVGLVQGQSMSSIGTYTTTQPLLTDYRSENYTTGRSVNISCTNKTWSEMIYTTWEIPKDRNLCTIAAHIDKLPVDNCLNGKVLRKTTNGKSYLHIPLFKDTDEGIYKCETAYVGTSYTAYITVSARVSLQISTRLDFRDGKREAVCSAEGGKPTASISWRNRWNSSVTQSTNKNLDGSFTVESRLILPDFISAGNLSCIITHPSWGEKHWFMSTQDNREGPHFSLKKLGIYISCVIIALAILAVFCILRKIPQKSRNEEIHGLQTVYTVVRTNNNSAKARRQESEI
ncbi:cell surface glycoprotein CD200 receptor 5-like [Conger conger]|uniref:cell surface glycoprotein CD200 receptor 5-like n=1 Tax=Conger conger TaxID=82655 RepID=UPI002A59A683|nr:cell surface glycoprotein CD200 receptor 5-like [Conger conger]